MHHLITTPHSLPLGGTARLPACNNLQLAPLASAAGGNRAPHRYPYYRQQQYHRLWLSSTRCRRNININRHHAPGMTEKAATTANDKRHITRTALTKNDNSGSLGFQVRLSAEEKRRIGTQITDLQTRDIETAPDIRRRQERFLNSCQLPCLVTPAAPGTAAADCLVTSDVWQEQEQSRREHQRRRLG
jgi:hypothetical protein